MIEELAQAIYDCLVKEGGAFERERERFIHEFTKQIPTSEWRFRGKLGFGGKYRWRTNSVDYYREDKTKEREQIIQTLNESLNLIKNEFDKRPKRKS